MARILSAEDVLNARFAQTQFREGYDEREVDEFLDSVVIALRHYANGGDTASAPLSAARITGATFTVTSFRRGYARSDIDALLDDVGHTLRTLEAGNVQAGERGPESGPAAPLPTPITTPKASSPSRLFGFLRGDKG